MDKSATTIIASTTIGAGETTDLSACTRIDNSRTTQLTLTANFTVNAASTESMFVYIYTSDDDSTYTDSWYDSWEINNCRKVYYISGDHMWMPEETVTASVASTGTGTVAGWTVEDGAFGDGDAEGWLYLEDITGTLSTAAVLTGGTSGCVAAQSGVITAHAVTRQYLSMSPTPLYIKARMHNGDTAASATLCSLVSVKQTI